jgi:hypothetical protein
MSREKYNHTYQCSIGMMIILFLFYYEREREKTQRKKIAQGPLVFVRGGRMNQRFGSPPPPRNKLPVHTRIHEETQGSPFIGR